MRPEDATGAPDGTAGAEAPAVAASGGDASGSGEAGAAFPREGSDGAVHRLYGGAFAGGPAPSLDELNRSLPVDRRLWREDVEGSRAWVRALEGVGVLRAEEADRLEAGLERVAGRLEGGAAEGAEDEDIHTLVERLLYEEVDELAGKLHTGRSRNDQVATDSRLWLMRAGERLASGIAGVQEALLAQAERGVDALMPAYTHLRRAQPVRVAHWFLAHFWALERDRDRLRDALGRVAVLPLGSGAIAGSGFPVDREALRKRLGFAAVSPNSLDAVGDRDWVVETIFVLSLTAAHLSRLAEDLIVGSTDEFGFFRLPEAYTTGSSLMPQKRNPDGLELARGKAARMVGDVAAALAMLKGLPSGYQKDLQEDKGLLFRAVDDMLALLPVTRETILGLELRADALRRAANDHAMLATDVADELVRRGVPFRQAHHVAGRLVRRAEELGVGLGALPADEFAAAHDAFAAGPPSLSAEASVEARGVAGGTGRQSVQAQIDQARARMPPPAQPDQPD